MKNKKKIKKKEGNEGNSPQPQRTLSWGDRQIDGITSFNIMHEVQREVRTGVLKRELLQTCSRMSEI